jgi:hypothetical protein
VGVQVGHGDFVVDVCVCACGMIGGCVWRWECTSNVIYIYLPETAPAKQVAAVRSWLQCSGPDRLTN